MWFGWKVKNFAQNLLISPRSTCKRGGGQSTLNSGKKFVGGEGGEGRGGGQLTLTQEEICRWGGGEGREGGQLTQLRKEICRWGGREGEGGGLMDTQLLHQETNVQFPQITNSYISLDISLLLLLFQQIKKNLTANLNITQEVNFFPLQKSYTE